LPPEWENGVLSFGSSRVYVVHLGKTMTTHCFWNYIIGRLELSVGLSLKILKVQAKETLKNCTSEIMNTKFGEA
jgi:hypothetical protein